MTRFLETIFEILAQHNIAAESMDKHDVRIFQTSPTIDSTLASNT